MLSGATATLNLLLGVIYLLIGAMIVIDLKRGWRTLGFSHFGVAFAALAFTCGPHHLAHGIHMAAEGRQAGALDTVAVVAGIPAGLIWFTLRVEAFRGGRGDRPIPGTPFWILMLPLVGAAYLTTLGAAAVQWGPTLDSFQAVIVPNVMLVAIYATIAYYLVRTQMQHHQESDGWSLSGICLAGVFGTCSLMHSTYVLYSFTGTYGYDPHAFAIDWISVPAGLYFLWVVQGLYRARLHDWNRELREAERQAVGSGALIPAR